MNSWLHGKPGVGKTATALWILRKIETEVGINGVYVNYWENPTFFSVLECIARALRILVAHKLSTSFKLERVKRHVSNERIVLVLDEIDRPVPRERKAILYNLSDLPTVGLICTCNSQYLYFSLDERGKSRINPARINFGQYSPDELFQIPDQRARYALAPGRTVRRSCVKWPRLRLEMPE